VCCCRPDSSCLVSVTLPLIIEGMETWGQTVYGEPCRECGFHWSISLDDAVSLVRAVPTRYGEALRGRDGRQHHPDLDWSAGAYVCHVSDNLRIWAERLAGYSAGATGELAPYDGDLLAEARVYERVPIQAALWSLESAVNDWKRALDLAIEEDIVLVHPERGRQTVLDVARTNAHDAHHHEWDIRRCLR
jgi:hypothetical protein